MPHPTGCAPRCLSPIIWRERMHHRATCTAAVWRCLSVRCQHVLSQRKTRPSPLLERHAPTLQCLGSTDRIIRRHGRPSAAVCPMQGGPAPHTQLDTAHRGIPFWRRTRSTHASRHATRGPRSDLWERDCTQQSQIARKTTAACVLHRCDRSLTPGCAPSISHGTTVVGDAALLPCPTWLTPCERHRRGRQRLPDRSLHWLRSVNHSQQP